MVTVFGENGQSLCASCRKRCLDGWRGSRDVEFHILFWPFLGFWLRDASYGRRLVAGRNRYVCRSVEG